MHRHTLTSQLRIFRISVTLILLLTICHPVRKNILFRGYAFGTLLQGMCVSMTCRSRSLDSKALPVTR